MKSTLALALLGLALCWPEIALSSNLTKETRTGDQLANLTQDASTSQRKQQKKPDAHAPQHGAGKEPVSRPAVVGEPLGPFSPLYIDP